jgi:hypothetical protein
MKRILFFLMFISSIAEAQLTANFFAVEGTSSNITTTTIASRTYTAGRLYIWFVQSRQTAGPPVTPTISMTGLTWTNIGTVTGHTVASPIYRTTAFVSTPASTTTVTGSVNWSTTQNGGWLFGYEVSGFSVAPTGTGEGNIRQVVTGNADATADPSITMATLSTDFNAVLVAFENNRNPFTATPEAGWTEHMDQGFSIGAGRYSMKQVTTSDNTPSLTSASANWLGMAIEVTSAGNRRRNSRM